MFHAWSGPLVSGLTFERLPLSRKDEAMVVIGWADHSDSNPHLFDGPGGKLAECMINPSAATEQEEGGKRGPIVAYSSTARSVGRCTASVGRIEERRMFLRAVRRPFTSRPCSCTRLATRSASFTRRARQRMPWRHTTCRIVCGSLHATRAAQGGATMLVRRRQAALRIAISRGTRRRSRRRWRRRSLPPCRRAPSGRLGMWPSCCWRRTRRIRNSSSRRRVRIQWIRHSFGCLACHF